MLFSFFSELVTFLVKKKAGRGKLYGKEKKRRPSNKKKSKTCNEKKKSGRKIRILIRKVHRK